MAFVTDRASPAVVIKGSYDTEWDEGFHSPSVEGKCEKRQAGVCNGSTTSDEQQEPSSLAASSRHTQEPASSSRHTQEPASSSRHTQEPASSSRHTQEPASSSRHTQEPASSSRHTQEPDFSTRHTQEPASSSRHTQEPASSSRHRQEPASLAASCRHAQEPASSSRHTQEPASSSRHTQEPASCRHTQEASVDSCGQSEAKSGEGSQEGDSVERKAASLAKYVVSSLVGKTEAKTNDKVEETLLRCVEMIMHRHHIFLKGMMKKLNITRETRYVSFFAAANELFEGGKTITWARIVALYAFSGQLALYCKEENMEDFSDTIVTFTDKYTSEVVVPFVRKAGGWIKLCEEFPAEEDQESEAWSYLTWTAIGLGLAATALFFTSR